MKFQLLLFLSLLLFSGCLPIVQSSSAFTPAERGWSCANSTILLDNVSKDTTMLIIDRTMHLLKPGEKAELVVSKGTHFICINSNCEELKLWPCIEYDFTPELL